MEKSDQGIIGNPKQDFKRLDEWIKDAVVENSTGRVKIKFEDGEVVGKFIEFDPEHGNLKIEKYIKLENGGYDNTGEIEEINMSKKRIVSTHTNTSNLQF
ncbi:MAG: hypothetical protein Q8Q30_02840 [Candidatus Woesebacteria bacterium]|nr:hypothetical protein [Candidatus Woesebacteria bacterium]